MVTVAAAGGDPGLPALLCSFISGNGNGDHPLINPGPGGGEKCGAGQEDPCLPQDPCSEDWPSTPYELRIMKARDIQHELNAECTMHGPYVFCMLSAHQFVPRSLFLPLLNSPFPALPAAMKSSLLFVPTRSPECPSPLKPC